MRRWRKLVASARAVPAVAVKAVAKAAVKAKAVEVAAGRARPATAPALTEPMPRRKANEERNLAEKIARREAVLQTYRMFDPIESDTSHLDPDAVLVAVLEVLHKSVLC